jgi:hypothetical protein
MLMSALLIHLTGGRIETHTHIFGSLAFLAFYRDPAVFIPATLVVLADHLLRGIYSPESAYGVTVTTWGSLECMASVGLDFRMATATGVRWAHGRTKPVRAQDGSVIGHVGTVEVVTGRKRIEE